MIVLTPAFFAATLYAKDIASRNIMDFERDTISLKEACSYSVYNFLNPGPCRGAEHVYTSHTKPYHATPYHVLP